MIDWKVSEDFIAYPDALEEMETRVNAIASWQAPECVWLLQHLCIYTLGTRGSQSNILDFYDFPTYTCGRGGQATYHSPGQRVGYVMLNLRSRNLDLHTYVHMLEKWLISSLKRLGITGEQRSDGIGVWV